MARRPLWQPLFWASNKYQNYLLHEITLDLYVNLRDGGLGGNPEPRTCYSCALH